jgi:hypothetical protein
VGFRRPLTQVLASESQSDVSSEGTPASQTQFLPRNFCLWKQRTRAHKARLHEFHRLAHRDADFQAPVEIHFADSSNLTTRLPDSREGALRSASWPDRRPARARVPMAIALITLLVTNDGWIGGCSDEALTKALLLAALSTTLDGVTLSARILPGAEARGRNYGCARQDSRVHKGGQVMAESTL